MLKTQYNHKNIILNILNCIDSISEVLFIIFRLNLVPRLFSNIFMMILTNIYSKYLLWDLMKRNINYNHLIFVTGCDICLYVYNIQGYHYIIVSIIINSLKNLNSKKYLDLAIRIGILSLKENLCVLVLLASVITLFYEGFKKMSNPFNNIKNEIRLFLKNLAIICGIPVLIFTLFYSWELKGLMNHSVLSSKFSSKFQFSLPDFNIKRGFDFKSIDYESNAVTDKFVMDRSVTSLISLKHKSFFINSEVVSGIQEFTFFSTIHKIHKDDFVDEEPRFIKNGDIIKFQSLKNDLFIGSARTDSEVKFVKITQGTYVDDEDLWEVVCDGYLHARETEVQFKHVKSGEWLCAKMDNKIASLYASAYSEKYSRVFIIGNNKNHDYFRANFKDYRSNEKVKRFTGYGFIQMFFDYISKIENDNTFSSDRTYLINIIFGIGIFLMILFNYISSRRYKTLINLSSYALQINFFYISYLLASLIIKTNSTMVLLLLETAVLLITESVVDSSSKSISIIKLKQLNG